MLESVTPFAMAHYRKAGWGLIEVDVLAVRATYQWSQHGEPLAIAPVQLPLRWGEQYAGPEDQPLRSIVAEDGDVEIGKLRTDVHVQGYLQAPGGIARREWLVGVGVGPVNKSMRVTGPRRFERNALGMWRATRPDPVERVRLDYRQAFGGCWLADTLDEHGEREYAAAAMNPAGIGWLPKAQDLHSLSPAARSQIKAQVQQIRSLAAPQFELSRQALSSPYDRQPPQGFGPIARWWSPRRERQGTFDDYWRTYRYPEWPDDFDALFYNSAHPDLMSKQHLRGDEEIALANCINEGARREGDLWMLRTHLPGMAIYAIAEFTNGQRQWLNFLLDTIVIDLDTRQVSMTWHALCTHELRLKRAIIGGIGLDLLAEVKARMPRSAGASRLAPRAVAP